MSLHSSAKSAVGTVLLNATLLACGNATGVEIDVTMSMDATSYVASVVPGTAPLTQYSFQVVVRTDNRSSAQVLLDRCDERSVRPLHDIVLVDATVGASSAYMLFWGCPAGASPLALQAGTSRIDTLRFLGPTRRNGITGAAIGEFDGPMRIWYASRPRQLQSNTFVVTRGP